MGILKELEEPPRNRDGKNEGKGETKSDGKGEGKGERRDEPLDLAELRKALGAFVTGVTVVTTLDEAGTPRGFTANSFTSVSLEPPLVLVCIAKASGSYPVFAGARGFAVNILAEDQRHVSSTFASRTADRFAVVNWAPGPAGNPVFEGAAAWLDCEMHDTHEAGDHLLLIGRIVGFESRPLPPLGYCRGAYMTFSLEQRAVAHADSHTRIGAILEWERSVLLLGAEDDGPLALPAAPRIGSTDEPESLLGMLTALGVEAQLGFLFAVFESEQGRALHVYYRGSARPMGPLASRARFFAFADIPWHRLGDEQVRKMLRRYVNERLEDRFAGGSGRPGRSGRSGQSGHAGRSGGSAPPGPKSDTR